MAKPKLDDEPDLTPRERFQRLSVLRRLFGLIAPYRVRFVVATVLLLIGSGLSLAYPQAARQAVNSGLSGGSMDKLNETAALLVLLFVVQAGLTWGRHYMMSWLGERVVADLRSRVYERVLRLPLAWFHERRVGEVTGRLASDVAVIQNIVGSELSMTLREIVTFVGGLTLLFIENAKLTLIMLAIVPPIIVLALVFGRRIRRMSEAVQDKLAETSAQVNETIGAIQTVQAFVREDREAVAYHTRVEAFFVDVVRLSSWRGAFIATMSLAGFLGITAMIWFGGREIVLGHLTGGDLTAFLLYTTMVAFSLGALAQLWGSLQTAAGATKRLFEILDTEATLVDPEHPTPLPAPSQLNDGCGVTFDDVGFIYPARVDSPVLEHVSLDVKPGEVVAFVGRSGAGKSTLVSLVQRFHDTTSGHVRVGGVDVRDLKLAELRGAVAIVAQEPVLFSGTVAENIAYARPDAPIDVVESAARAAHAHEFISSFAEGYRTRIGERGVKLSGGQRQRLAIARAIVANPRVLILDEATSNLDAESEALVQEALARLMKGRTTLVIAHRLSTVRDADRIVVLDHGRVVEVGSHDALMHARGLYHKLVEHQLIFGELAA